VPEVELHWSSQIGEPLLLHHCHEACVHNNWELETGNLEISDFSAFKTTGNSEKNEIQLGFKKSFSSEFQPDLKFTVMI
jgi:hypothetical protein